MDERINEGKLEQIFRKGLLMVGIILILVAVIQLFFAVNRLISIWFTYRYQPIFQAIYSTGVIVLVIYFLKSYISDDQGGSK